MLYLFAGDDTEKKNTALLKFLGPLSKTMPQFSIERGNFSPEQVEALYSGAGLFFEKSATIFTGLLEYGESRDFLLGKLKSMEESGNTFVFKEGALKKAVTDEFKKARAEINIFEKSKEKKERFNSFVLANALGDRNKLNLWVNFRQAMEEDVGLEELAGVLFWKTKDMLLKKSFSKYTENELQKISSEISYLLPRARREGHDAEAAFEEFLLEVV